MKGLVTLWLALCLPGQLQACEQDPQLLERIAQRTAQTATWRATFQQENHLAVISQPLVSDGEVFVDERLGIVWRTHHPIASSLVVREDGLQIGGETVAASRLVAGLLRSVISGQPGSLTQLFNWTGCNDETGWQLTLTPVDDQLARRIVQLKLSGAASVEQLEVSQPGGNSMVVRFATPQPLDVMPEPIANLLNAGES